ncbi:hypothetical protein OG250_09510 [Streptomyces sp. NBC_00487]|uniref:hypothetical protein n=1 Tax=unclassified Streptomyces TaxID=2593676 RepID=UPI002DD9C985|nr:MULTISPECIES: hypothetical protein [unclassified Streptomyces]WRY95098.1 hypothetical protein OG889_10365 [Streptomyces sp. NBC_00481]
MRSARMLLATAAATAVLAITAPGAYADGDGGKWDHGDHGYSKEHDKDSSHDGPHGGVHTGGGALTSLNNEGEWDSGQAAKPEAGGYDKEESTKESWKGEHDKGSWKGDHDQPRGGMHTGGGALASPTVTAGGMAVLAVAGTGMYALRRRKTAGSVA